MEASYNYDDFIARKHIRAKDTGLEIDRDELNPGLFEWQKDIVIWALRKGRAALFEGCGLGKTVQQLDWARIIYEKTEGNILILAPLAVAKQTQREGLKFGISVTVCRTQTDVQPGINVTNYEMLEHFDPGKFVGIVLDESSILKSMTGKTRTSLIRLFQQTPYRLCCTATPAPNDHMEIGNHSEFLGTMPNVQMLAKFFVNDASKTGTWRLKGHGVKPFWEWVSSWAVFVTKPSDIGYQDDSFDLPPLNINKVVVSAPTDYKQGFFGGNLGAMELHRRGRVTAPYRAKAVADLVNSNDEQWMVWCNSNYEADELRQTLPKVTEIRGGDSNDKKESAIMDFIGGKTRVLVSKPSIFGFGLNLQICHNVVFAGMSYSFEQAYQAIRRFWRFGQESPVNVHYVMDMSEIGIFDSVMEKERKHKEMEENMVNFIDSEKELKSIGSTLTKVPVNMGSLTGNDWELRQGDSIRLVKDIPDNSVHFSIFSPPFSNIFVYSDDPADMGNCLDDDEFFDHFQFLVPELLRVTVPGRLCVIHCSVLPIFKWKEDVIGLKDFRGQIIRLFQKHGWIFHSEVCIWKDPVVEMQRTKSLGLLYKQLRKDSSQCRQGLPDYLVVFRKWPNSVNDIQPVEHTPETFDLPLWQRYASPVWFDIDQQEVLNYRLARSEKDERHICPLQLGVIRRCLKMWTNQGDLVLSPFAGIGSEGYEAIKAGCRFLGLELKPEYVKVAADNLLAAERISKRQNQGFCL